MNLIQVREKTGRKWINENIASGRNYKNVHWSLFIIFVVFHKKPEL